MIFFSILFFRMYLRHGARATMGAWERLEKQHDWTDSHAQGCLPHGGFKLQTRFSLYCFIQFQFRLNHNISLNFHSKMRSDMLYFCFSNTSNILITRAQRFRYSTSTL